MRPFRLRVVTAIVLAILMLGSLGSVANAGLIPTTSLRVDAGVTVSVPMGSFPEDPWPTFSLPMGSFPEDPWPDGS